MRKMVNRNERHLHNDGKDDKKSVEKDSEQLHKEEEQGRIGSYE